MEVSPQFQFLNGFNLQSLLGPSSGFGPAGTFQSLPGSVPLGANDPLIGSVLSGGAQLTGSQGGLFTTIRDDGSLSLFNISSGGTVPIGGFIEMAPPQTFAPSGTSERANLQGILNGVFGMSLDQLNSHNPATANLIAQAMFLNQAGR